MGLTSGLSTPNEVGRKACDNLFDGTAPNVKALDALFNNTGRGLCR